MTERNELEQKMEARIRALAEDAERERQAVTAQRQLEIESNRRDQNDLMLIKSMFINFADLLQSRGVKPHSTYGRLAGIEEKEVIKNRKPGIRGLFELASTEVREVEKIVNVEAGWNVERYPHRSSSDSDGFTTHIGAGGLAVLQSGLLVRWGGKTIETHFRASSESGAQRAKPQGPPYAYEAVDPFASPYDKIAPEARVEQWEERVVDWGAKLLQ